MIVSTIKIIIIAVYSCFLAALSIICVPFVKSEGMLFKIFKLYARGVLSIGGVRLEVHGLDAVDFKRNYLYVANHASYFDIPAVVAGIPDNVRFVYKRELNKVPIFGWGMKLTGYNIAIDRTSGQDALKSLEIISQRLRDGASVMLFAEGTRTPDGTMKSFKRGPFTLAVKANVAVVPVAIQGSYNVLSRHSWRIRSGKISITLGEPIPPPHANGKNTELELRDQTYAVIERNLQQQG